jgi:two-component system, OmpR family, phosphate regulon response regulator PhoB
MQNLLMQLLRSENYDAIAASTSAEALSSVARDAPDLVLLDVVLGNEDGRDVLQELRIMSDVPVVFLTGRGLEMDRIAGLKLGADDYVVKPFSPPELSARIETVLRRYRATSSSESPVIRPILEYHNLRIDPWSREVHVEDRLITFTAKEFDLLAFLAASPRQVFTRQQLLERVWSSSTEWQDASTVTEHIRRVRRKIENDPDRPTWVTTVRGVGYRFEPSGGDRAERQLDSFFTAS